MNLVGIAGAAGAGKTTAADYLMEEFGYAQYSFAQPLKAGLAAMMGIEDPGLLEELKDEPLFDLPGCPTTRQALQTLGTEWAREMICDDFWVLMAARVWQDMKENPSPFLRGLVVPDVRFMNELAWVKNNGGKLIYIDCEKPFRDAPDHASEQHHYFRGRADFVIENNGSLDDFEAALSRLAPQLAVV